VHETDPRVCQTRSLTICIQKGEEYLPLLKAPPKQPKSATIQIRVEEDVKLRLEKYAEFINSSPADVVTEALKLLFKKDEEFKSNSESARTQTRPECMACALQSARCRLNQSGN